jgi:hypothetical protein
VWLFSSDLCFVWPAFGGWVKSCDECCIELTELPRLLFYFCIKHTVVCIRLIHTLHPDAIQIFYLNTWNPIKSGIINKINLCCWGNRMPLHYTF